MIKVFISRSTADEREADKVAGFLEDALGVHSAEAFCASLEILEISTGKSFLESDYIRDQSQGPNFVIMNFSQGHCGIALFIGNVKVTWVILCDMLHLLIPLLSYEDVKDILLGTQHVVASIRVNSVGS